MKAWTRESLIRSAGRHVYSGRDARIQVIEVASSDALPWTIPHGSLLAIVLSGTCVLVADGAERELNCEDQVLLLEGESFAFRVASAERQATLQCIWMPGVSSGE